MLASAITLEHRSPVGFGTKEPASRSPVDAFSPPSSRYPGSIPIKVYLWCIGRELVAKKSLTRLRLRCISLGRYHPSFQTAL